jgi:hypothetical protein
MEKGTPDGVEISDDSGKLEAENMPALADVANIIHKDGYLADDVPNTTAMISGTTGRSATKNGGKMIEIDDLELRINPILQIDTESLHTLVASGAVSIEMYQRLMCEALNIHPMNNALGLDAAKSNSEFVYVKEGNLALEEAEKRREKRQERRDDIAFERTMEMAAQTQASQQSSKTPKPTTSKAGKSEPSKVSHKAASGASSSTSSKAKESK